MRTDSNKQVFRCFLKTLTPIHIGCDEIYEPTGFIVDETDGNLVVFNPISFIGDLTDEDRSKFSEICSRGTLPSILDIYKFLRGKKAEGRIVKACDDFIAHYQQTLSIPSGNEKKIQQDLNRFFIHRTVFLASDQRPYIPGSSVKGALRTAYMNLMQTEKRLPKWKNTSKSNELEHRLADHSGISDDPFRLVKVSDFMPVGDAETKILYGVNEKKKVSDKAARGNAQLFEIIEPGTLFSGIISVEKPLNGAGIRRPVEMQTLLNSASRFFGKEKIREDKELAIHRIPGVAADVETGILIRCGRHSGGESVTIDGHRNIRIMVKNGSDKFLDHATTIWLASEVRRPKIKKNLTPFGWSQLFELSQTHQKEFIDRETAFNRQVDLEKEAQALEAERRLKIQREAQAFAEQKAKQAEEERLAEEDRQRAFEQMTPEERDVAALENPNVIENTVVEIFNRLDDFSEKNKVKAAAGIKKFFQANNKWKVNKKKKQWQKVNKLKEILGEQ